MYLGFYLVTLASLVSVPHPVNVVLDWLIFVTIQPDFVVIPGTEGLAGYKDYGFHFLGGL